jgi:hypothetical protein
MSGHIAMGRWVGHVKVSQAKLGACAALSRLGKLGRARLHRETRGKADSGAKLNLFLSRVMIAIAITIGNTREDTNN